MMWHFITDTSHCFIATVHWKRYAGKSWSSLHDFGLGHFMTDTSTTIKKGWKQIGNSILSSSTTAINRPIEHKRANLYSSLNSKKVWTWKNTKLSGSLIDQNSLQ